VTIDYNDIILPRHATTFYNVLDVITYKMKCCTYKHVLWNEVSVALPRYICGI